MTELDIDLNFLIPFQVSSSGDRHRWLIALEYFILSCLPVCQKPKLTPGTNNHGHGVSFWVLLKNSMFAGNTQQFYRIREYRWMRLHWFNTVVGETKLLGRPALNSPFSELLSMPLKNLLWLRRITHHWQWSSYSRVSLNGIEMRRAHWP